MPAQAATASGLDSFGRLTVVAPGDERQQSKSNESDEGYRSSGSPDIWIVFDEDLMLAGRDIYGH